MDADRWDYWALFENRPAKERTSAPATEKVEVRRWAGSRLSPPRMPREDLHRERTNRDRTNRERTRS